MTFPTTSVLDSFNAGASQNLTARAGWSASDTLGTVLTSFGSLATDTVPTYAANNAAGNAWGTSFTDAEVWATVSVIPVANQVRLVARWDTAGQNGYELQMFPIGGGTYQLGLYKYITGTQTSLVNESPMVPTPANGDSIGFSVIGTTLTAYHKPAAGAWTQHLTTTDSSITAAGVIGLVSVETAVRFDEFGGGAIASGEISGPRQQAVPFTRGAGGGGKI